MQKRFEDLLRNKNITTEIRAQALENIFPLLILIGRVVRDVEITEWFGITPFTAVDVCRRYSTTWPRYPLRHFVYFYYYYYFLVNIYPGAFNLAELVYNGALTQHKNKDIKTLRFFIIHTQKRSFMAVSSVRTKLDSFYLHISSFEKLPIWIWYPVPFVVNAILNLFNTHKMLSRQ